MTTRKKESTKTSNLSVTVRTHGSVSSQKDICARARAGSRRRARCALLRCSNAVVRAGPCRQRSRVPRGACLMKDTEVESFFVEFTKSFWLNLPWSAGRGLACHATRAMNAHLTATDFPPAPLHFDHPIGRRRGHGVGFALKGLETRGGAWGGLRGQKDGAAVCGAARVKIAGQHRAVKAGRHRVTVERQDRAGRGLGTCIGTTKEE